MLKQKKIFFCDIVFHAPSSFVNLPNKFKNGGTYMFPSGPGLSEIDNDPLYLNSLICSNYNFLDSGFFVFLLKFKNINAQKFSGYLFLRHFFDYLKNNNITNYLLVDPDKINSALNRSYMNKNIVISIFDPYIAPKYCSKNPKDFVLLKYINDTKPKFIILNIGGGIQEKLAIWLYNKINYKVNIICTGAAISFFTKSQAPIGKLIDKFYLGWLARCIHNPKIFIPRYFKAFKLLKVYLKNIDTLKVTNE